MERVLVVVHPGSACGSASYNLGRAEAQSARDDLADELTRWDGGVVVIDGALSDELPEYPHLARAINRALKRARDGGRLALRLYGDDPHHSDVIAGVAIKQDWATRRVACTVTGAWYHPDDHGGCVGSVHQRLVLLQVESVVSDHAVCIDPEETE